MVGQSSANKSINCSVILSVNDHNHYAIYFCRWAAFKLQDRVGPEGMLQLVLCRVGTHNVFLVMVRLVTQSLRFVDSIVKPYA